MNNSSRQVVHYEVRDADLEAVLTLDGYPCVYEYMDEAQDAAEMLSGRVAVLLLDGTYVYL